MERFGEFSILQAKQGKRETNDERLPHKHNILFLIHCSIPALPAVVRARDIINNGLMYYIAKLCTNESKNNYKMTQGDSKGKTKQGYLCPIAVTTS